MIKGVSKQIVEINYTQDDYVEKAILIINPQKSKLSRELLTQKAGDYMETLLPDVQPHRKRFRLLAAAAICGLLLILAAAVLTAALLI
ncbi:MAG: hypothetical protein HFE43_03900 [Oscillospiraceae bacterium]|nr:hypothetical protein [Oscillospiraceae bacterium]